MVQNIDAMSFAPFGRVKRVSKNQSAIKDRTERVITIEAPETKGYRACAPVLLDFDTGMAVLAVLDEEQNFQFFYLDKPVWVNAGVTFALMPYQLNCTVRMAVDRERWPVEAQLDVTAQDLTVSRRVLVERVYTFFYHEKEPGFFFRGETHSMLELTYVDKGAVHSVVGGQDMVLEQGDMAIYGPDQWHMQYADPDCAPSYVTITFDLSGESVSHLLNRKFRMPDPAIQVLRKMLHERDHNNDPYTGDMLVNLLGQLLLIVLRDAQPNRVVPYAVGYMRKENSIHSENEMVATAQQFIGENIRSKLTVPLVAKEVGVSTSYLTALFHRCLQISPGEYIRRTKLQESKVMIREGRMNFTEIARVLHYSTVHHFSRQFKDKFGLTPTEYARSIR